jgi:hypothetical protein
MRCLTAHLNETEVIHLRQSSDLILDMSDLLYVAIGEDICTGRQARAVRFAKIETEEPFSVALLKVVGFR